MDGIAAAGGDCQHDEEQGVRWVTAGYAAPGKNLAHSASFQSREKTAPSNPGIKHLGLSWGGGAAWLWPPSESLQLFWVFVVGGMCAGAAALHHAHLPTALAFILSGDPVEPPPIRPDKRRNREGLGASLGMRLCRSPSSALKSSLASSAAETAVPSCHSARRHAQQLCLRCAREFGFVHHRRGRGLKSALPE